ncbi:MAG: PepSY domain-containing protein [Breznakia sp.]
MKKYLISTVAVLFLLVGCSLDDDRNDVDNKITDTKKQDNAGDITLEEAKAIALKDVDGKVVKQREDYDDGVTYYEIDIVVDGVKYEYKIDTQGTIISKEQEQINTTTNQTQYITSQEAQDIIIKHAGGGTITSCELDKEGSAVYEIEMVKDNQEYDATVDATSGKVLQYGNDY